MARDPRIERGLLAQLAERRRRIDAGERPLGWKLGMGVPAAMEKLGISAPLVGYLLESARLGSGDTCDVSGWANPRLEPEVAAWIGSDVPGDASREDAVGRVAGLGVAIELVDPDPDADDPERILAANIFQRHVVLGPAKEVAGSGGLSAFGTRNGEEAFSVDDATEATGDLFELVAHVARTVAAAGEALRAGDVVICGSVVPALEVTGGDEVEVTVEPLGSLRVAFA